MLVEHDPHGIFPGVVGNCRIRKMQKGSELQLAYINFRWQHQRAAVSMGAYMEMSWDRLPLDKAERLTPEMIDELCDAS